MLVAGPIRPCCPLLPLVGASQDVCWAGMERLLHFSAFGVHAVQLLVVVPLCYQCHRWWTANCRTVIAFNRFALNVGFIQLRGGGGSD